MRKIQMFFSCVILILISFLGYLYEVKKDRDNWKSWGESEKSIEFYLYKENIDNFSDKEIIKILEEVAGDTNVSLIKKSYFSENDKISIVKGIKQKDVALPAVSLKNGEKTYKFDFKNKEYSTDKNIKYYFNDDTVIFENLDKSIEKYGANGEYIVIANKYSDGELFLDKLSKRMNIDVSKLLTKKHFEKTDYSTQFYVFSILFILFILIYSISNVFYVTKQSKEIAILKLR